ncbi:MAG: glycosyltransferase [Clostridiales bacterium]|nr:glycosyltransferase [Clostridiales bacterium]
MKVLVLSVTAGQGHNSCGKAVVEACTRKGIESVMMDTLLQSSKLVANSVDKVYVSMTLHAPGVWKKMYDDMLKENKVRSRQGTGKLIATWFYKEIVKLIQSFEPDAIVCTHVFAGIILTYIRKRMGLNIPFIGVNTDFTLLPMWEDTELDLYVLSAEALCHSAIARGIPGEKLFPHGIPIHNRFASAMPKADARKELGIEDKPTVLIMSGSMGFGNLPQVVQSLDALPMDLQMLVVCGKNQKMYEKISALKTKKTVHTYGFVNNVEVMMDASDMILTKPGGLSTSEALAKNLPMILLDPIPGLEERNCLFLAAHGAGIMSNDRYTPAEAVMGLLSEPERLSQILTMQRKLGKPNSADDLVNKIMEMVEQQKNRESCPKEESQNIHVPSEEEADEVIRKTIELRDL